jgi:hypothetical protein
MDTLASLNHSYGTAKYHVVFILKCRRRTLYGELRVVRRVNVHAHCNGSVFRADDVGTCLPSQRSELSPLRADQGALGLRRRRSVAWVNESSREARQSIRDFRSRSSSCDTSFIGLWRPVRRHPSVSKARSCGCRGRRCVPRPNRCLELCGIGSARPA